MTFDRAVGSGADLSSEERDALSKERVSRELAEQFSVAIEEVAVEHAHEIGFDMETERHALFRMMMAVLSTKELRDRAIFRMGELSQTEAKPEEGEDHA